MRKYLLSILLLLFALSPYSLIASSISNSLSDSAQILLLTCTPGTEVWSKYGHTGIRVIDHSQQLDIVFNYGIFDLTADDFYIKFVHGETYYQLGIEPYRYFDMFYRRIGRTTYWQELNLTQSQKQQIFDALLINYQPQNRYYLYNFVFDNCATRPYYLIKNALQDTIISSYRGYEGTTFRQAITHYTGHNSWVDFGINLVFGNDADQPMTNEQRLFLPEELMNYMAQAHLSDGTPLVKKQHIAAFPEAVVPWYAHCEWGIALFAVLMLLLSLYDRKRGKMAWGVDLALGIIYLLLIALVIFLTGFSCHPLVGFNWRLLLFPFIHVCTRIVYIFR
jgi:hypothetical protein